MSLRRWNGRVAASFAAGLAVLIWLASAQPVGATTLIRMDLPDLVSGAERVVHARAVDQKVYWDASGTRIYTDTTFEVLEDAKGTGPNRLTVWMLGGRIDPAEMTVEGTPIFRIGEEVVLFTSPGPAGKKNLVGFSQGVLRVLENPQTGEKIVANGAHPTLTFVEPGAEGLERVQPHRMRAPLPVMLDTVRRLAAEGAAPGRGLSRQRADRLEPETPADGRKP